MDKRFYTTEEVAELLRIKPKTLRCYHSQHELYRPARAGVWHVEHVSILEKVWMGVLTDDEGLALWKLKKKGMRETYLEILTDSHRAKGA